MKTNPNLYNGIGGCYRVTDAGEVVPETDPSARLPTTPAPGLDPEADLKTDDVKTAGK